jgi:uncharacterized repeat protein (TIGR01451 family)
MHNIRLVGLFGMMLIAMMVMTIPAAFASHPGVSGGVVDVDGFVRNGATGIEPGYLGSGGGIAYVQDSGSDQFVGALFSNVGSDDDYYYFAFEEDVNNNDNSYGDGSSDTWGNRGHRLSDLVNSEHAEIQLLGVDAANPDLANPTVIGQFSIDYAYDLNTYNKVKGQNEIGPDGWLASNVGTYCQDDGDGAIISGIQPVDCGTSLVWNVNNVEDGLTPLDSPVPFASDNAWVYELVYEFAISKADVAASGSVLHPFTPIRIVEVHNSPFRIGNLPGNVSATLNKVSDPASGETISRAQEITYTVSFTNPNVDPITNVVITDPIDNNLTVTDPGTAILGPYTGPCDSTGLTGGCDFALVWTLASVDGFTVEDLTYKAKLADGVLLPPEGVTVYDQAYAAWDGMPTNLPGDGLPWTPQVNHTIIGAPTITIDKLVSASIDGVYVDTLHISAAGTVYGAITYQNVGDVDLDTLILTESATPLTIEEFTVNDGILSADAAGQGNGESITIIYSQVITQAEFDSGSVDNLATISARDVSNPNNDLFPVGGRVEDSDPAYVVADPAPAIGLVKSLTGNADGDLSATVSLNDVLTYSFVVTNTGNVTLTDVTVSDPLPGLSAVSPVSVATLAPDASTTFTATYTVTQADVDAGNIHNQAFATGTPPIGDDVTDTDPEDVPVPQNPSIGIVKTVDPTTVEAAGETVTYTYVITNTGDVTLSGVTLNDDKLGAIALSVTTLAPGASTTATADHTISQAEFDAGALTNVGTTTGTPPSGPAVTANDDAVVTMNQNPSILVEKSATPDTGLEVGDVVTYNYVVTNTGDVTLTNVTLLDDKLGAITLGATTLAPGESTNGSATYTIQSSDITNGSLTNVALATGTPPIDPPVTDDDTVTLDFVNLTLTKTVSLNQPVPITITNSATATANNGSGASGDPTASVTVTVTGQTELTYLITVCNTGNAGATDVTITDSVPAGTAYVDSNGSLSGGVITWSIDSLAAGDCADVWVTVTTQL